jgi:hypothetical protein
MPLVHLCRERGCETLTMGERCLEHELLAEVGRLARLRSVFERLRAPTIVLAFAVLAAFIGRASARFGS